MITSVSPDTTSLTVPRSHPVAIAPNKQRTRLKPVYESRHKLGSTIEANYILMRNEAVWSHLKPRARFRTTGSSSIVVILNGTDITDVLKLLATVAHPTPRIYLAQ